MAFLPYLILFEVFLEVTEWRVFCGPARLFHKIDLAKVFDRFEWDLIQSAVTNLGLSNHFVNLVKECITSTKLSNLVNPIGCSSSEQ
jgi:hypothetical protein